VCAIHSELGQSVQRTIVDNEPKPFKDRYRTSWASASERAFVGPEIVSRETMRYSCNCLRVIESALVDYPERGRLSEAIFFEKFGLAKPVVLGDRPQNVTFLYIAGCHSQSLRRRADKRG
jgi:hypothetical protein